MPLWTGPEEDDESWTDSASTEDDNIDIIPE